MIRICLLFFTIFIINLSYVSASDKTSQMGIGVYDLIIKNTKLNKLECADYKCTFESNDKAIKIEVERVGFDQFLSRDLNIIMDINVDSVLFNCNDPETPCKNGLVVHYHNDANLIRVYIKGAGSTIEATTKTEIKVLRSWLNFILKLATA